jgi:methyl-accepting chemotaxis protein
MSPFDRKRLSVTSRNPFGKGPEQGRNVRSPPHARPLLHRGGKEHERASPLAGVNRKLTPPWQPDSMKEGRSSTEIHLTHAQVDAVVARHNRGNALTRDLGDLWEGCADILSDICRLSWTQALDAEVVRPVAGIGRDDLAREAAASLRAMFTTAVDRDWAFRAASIAALIHPEADCTAVGSLYLDRAGLFESRLRESDVGDAEARLALVCAFHRINSCEMTLVIAELALIRREKAARDLSRAGEAFQGDVARQLSTAQADSAALRRDCEDTARAARHTLERALEVATAAEQSSTAMLDAARTAAGLSQSIAEVESRVTRSSDLFTRACASAEQAVRSSEWLSDQAQSIESILGLIRDIAGQTNLLALNATIEAARAGDAGRGFAVVAQEVKSLASQTARATDDIARKIAAIQTATEDTVKANAEIQRNFDQLTHSTQEINAALARQSGTVTIIAASVDETARTADSISGTIDAIRGEVQTMVDNVARLDRGSRTVDTHLSQMQASTRSFLRSFAQ